ncbi:hypothetical protein FRB90_001817 [Tulasnella sp. 427]|nr:hypothetical protein FRB90_001817 [Tulasnella sp. 427]
MTSTPSELFLNALTLDDAGDFFFVVGKKKTIFKHISLGWSLTFNFMSTSRDRHISFSLSRGVEARGITIHLSAADDVNIFKGEILRALLALGVRRLSLDRTDGRGPFWNVELRRNDEDVVSILDLPRAAVLLANATTGQ